MTTGREETMPAYMIVDEDVFDSDGLAEYSKAAGRTIAQYGGKAIVRATEAEVLEGTWNRSTSSCSNLRAERRRSAGTTHRSTRPRSRSDSKPRRATLSS